MGLGLRWKCTGMSWTGKGCQGFVQKSTQTNKIQKMPLRLWATDWNRGLWFWFWWMVYNLCEKLVPPTEINEEDFIIYRYEGEIFPGQVTGVHPKGKGARIKVFDKYCTCAGGWRWPKQTDEIDYVQGDIIHIIAEDSVSTATGINNRGTYRIVELEERCGTKWLKQGTLIDTCTLNTYKPISSI